MSIKCIWCTKCRYLICLNSSPFIYDYIHYNLKKGQTYELGGYYGWEWNWQYPDLYPFADLHISIGDTILFKSRDWTPDDVWLVTEDVFKSCNFSNTTGLRQLANNNEIRGDIHTEYMSICSIFKTEMGAIPIIDIDLRWRF